MKKQETLEMFNELILNNKLYHAVILSCDDQDTLNEVSINIVRMQFCDNHSLLGDGCNWCQRIINLNSSNVFILGDGVSKIKKTEVLEVINKFSQTSLEDNKNKMYIIRNGETLSEDSANSLLKFLEEPPLNTYAIICTNDRTQILSTIKSRSKFFNINVEKPNMEHNKLNDLINSKSKDDILLYGTTLKALDKIEIIEILNDTYKNNILKNLPHIASDFIDAIDKIKSTNFYNLILENLLITIYNNL